MDKFHGSLEYKSLGTFHMIQIIFDWILPRNSDNKLIMAKLQILLIAAVCAIAGVNGHGRLMKPPSRSSVWRIPEFQNQNPPPNYTDNELFCGGLHQENDPGTNCGVCGDPQSQGRPRDNENGGKYAKGIITGKYSAGQVLSKLITKIQNLKKFAYLNLILLSCRPLMWK